VCAVVVIGVNPTAAPRSARWTEVLSRLRSAVSERLYLPACAVGAVAAGLIALGWSTGWGGADFSGSVGALHLVVVGPTSLSVLAVILVLERLRPAQQRPLFARGPRQDLLFTALHGTLGVLLITALTLSFQEIVRLALPWLVLPRMGLLPRSAAIGAIVVAMDAANWFVHLANHRVRVLWRFHELHHSQEDMNVMTVFRTHPLIHVSYLLAVLPVVVILANGAVPTAILVVYGGIVAFAHSNTNLGFGPLRRVLVSPNYHRIHHRLQGPQDVNLAFVFTVWDQLGRRAVFPTAETIGIDTGIQGRPLRVEQEGPRARHLAAFGAQLVGPFRPMRQPVDLPSVHAKTPEPDVRWAAR
jgi:sterol desaturase/sphingolipid hydroxylase (fatty acid hydroxylase superfamily)